jgi:hypothetical protein
MGSGHRGMAEFHPRLVVGGGASHTWTETLGLEFLWQVDQVFRFTVPQFPHGTVTGWRRLLANLLPTPARSRVQLSIVSPRGESAPRIRLAWKDHKPPSAIWKMR